MPSPSNFAYFETIFAYFESRMYDFAGKNAKSSLQNGIKSVGEQHSVCSATQWMMLGIAMAVVECGTANQDYLSMLKGFSLATDQ